MTNFPESSSPDVYDEWFQSERGTELDEEEIPDFDSSSDTDEY